MDWILIEHFDCADGSTPEPDFLGPASDTVLNGVIPLRFSLPTVAMLGSVQLVIKLSGSNSTVLLITFSSLFETAGLHSIDLPFPLSRAAIDFPGLVASISPLQTDLVAAVGYDMTIQYRDSTANPIASVTRHNIKLRMCLCDESTACVRRD